jgi:lipopolysaccharide/colanic/teichoic acid biosynthesis glycosyltransferase
MVERNPTTITTAKEAITFRAAEITSRCLAGFGLIVSAPLLAIAAAAVWLEDGLPIFFCQWRVGQHGARFQIVKIRSMAVRSSPGSAITQGGDARITAVGGILRKYKLDELPQLWNILRGEMAWVGPRPEVPEFVDLRDPLWREVLSVKPGITNGTTLLLRNEEDILAGHANPEQHYREHLLPLKLRLHRDQIRDSSLVHDIKVVAMTIYFAVFPSRFDPEWIQRSIASAK